MSSYITLSIHGKEAEKLKDRIREEALKEGMSMSEWVVEAILDKLRESNGKS